jgi:hypothetical protein
MDYMAYIWHKHHLNVPNANFSSYREGVYYAWTKLQMVLQLRLKSQIMI